MASPTVGTFLMYKTTLTGDYVKLIDIKGYPDLIGKPSKIETTTCSDTQQTFISGVREMGDMVFTTNFDEAEYETLLANEHKDLYLAVWFARLPDTVAALKNLAPNPYRGQFEFQGQYILGVPGKNINEAREITLTVYPTSATVFSVPEESTLA
jgi:hypothetical protein